MHDKRLLYAIAMITVILTTFCHGMLTDRWTISNEVVTAAQRLEQIPLAFGDWHGQELPEMPDSTQQAAGAVGYVRREYVNRVGERVSITLLCGRAGPISSHAPSVCFAGSGYRQQESEVAKDIATDDEKSTSTFFTATFLPPETRPGPDFETYWACSANGSQWDAVNDGRVKYAGRPFLYRMFATTSRIQTAPEGTEPVMDRFLKEFLPVAASSLSK